MRARGVQGGTPAEVAAAVEDSRADGFAPTLAIVFASVAHDLADVGAVFAAAGIDVFGASSAGEILAAGQEDCVYEQAIVGLLLDLDRAAYRLGLIDGRDQADDAMGRATGAWVADTFAEPALLVMVAGMWADGDRVLRGLLAATGGAVPVYGALAGDDLRLRETIVFTNGAVANRGVLALSIDRTRVEVRGMAVCGWEAVGGERRVTKAEGTVVHTLDGVPALDVYRDYLGLTGDSDIKLLEYPLQLARDDGSMVLRAPFAPGPAADSLFCVATVPEGSTVRFSAAPGPEISDRALEEVGELQRRMASADALVLFSCLCRHLALGPAAEDEVQAMRALWGAPLVGLYSYGEIGPNSAGRYDFHNQTCVLVALNER